MSENISNPEKENEISSERAAEIREFLSSLLRKELAERQEKPIGFTGPLGPPPPVSSREVELIHDAFKLFDLE